jgi:hypothetical protein
MQDFAFKIANRVTPAYLLGGKGDLGPFCALAHGTQHLQFRICYPAYNPPLIHLHPKLEMLDKSLPGGNQLGLQQFMG